MISRRWKLAKAKRIVRVLETADQCAMAFDGPVPKTREVLSDRQMDLLLRDS